jgi:uracil phosphoribosyltransferase
MLHILDHPLGNHVITHLRDHRTNPVSFRALTYQIGLLLAMEATRDLETKPLLIQTPMEPHEGRVLAKPLVIVPILRAGLAMVQPFTDLFPDITVGYIGLERDHDTAIPHDYYCKLPPMESKRVMLVDPMLATGGSAIKALKILRQNGAVDVTLICVVSAPEGVKAVEEVEPALSIFTAAHDRTLNAQKYILPGLGDFGDRLYGT